MALPAGAAARPAAQPRPPIRLRMPPPYRRTLEPCCELSALPLSVLYASSQPSGAFPCRQSLILLTHLLPCCFSAPCQRCRLVIDAPAPGCKGRGGPGLQAKRDIACHPAATSWRGARVGEKRRHVPACTHVTATDVTHMYYMYGTLTRQMHPPYVLMMYALPCLPQPNSSPPTDCAAGYSGRQQVAANQDGGRQGRPQV